MAILDPDRVAAAQASAKQAAGQVHENSNVTGLGDIGTAATSPRFLPSNLLDVSLCRTQEDLDKVKSALAEFRKIVNWTKQKFSMQKTAADLALELAKSQNELLSHYAKTAVKQAQSDAELASLLAAIPQMLTAVNGTVATKTEQKVRAFTDRIAAAGAGKSTAKAATK